MGWGLVGGIGVGSWWDGVRVVFGRGSAVRVGAMSPLSRKKCTFIRKGGQDQDNGGGGLLIPLRYEP